MEETWGSGHQSVGLWRDNGRHSQIKHQLARFVTLIGPVHDHGRTMGRGLPAFQQGTALRHVMGVAARQAECQCKPIICGNQVDFGIPAAARFANRLRSVFWARRCHPDAL